jgi:alpha-glucosidase
MLLLTLPGTLTVYYGEEIGMTNVPILPEEVQDPAEKNEPGLGLGRDPERTPMQWDESTSAGFTVGKPWLPVSKDHSIANVAALQQNPDSILHLYRKLIDLRRKHATWVTGTMQFVASENNVLRYQRRGEHGRILVLLNMGQDPAQAPGENGTVLISTHFDGEGRKVSGTVNMKGAEGLIIELDT